MAAGSPWLTVLSVEAPFTRFKKSGAPDDLIEQWSQSFVAHLIRERLFDKPCLLMGYSIGGILLKQTIVDLGAFDVDLYIKRRSINLQLLIFMGVPHRGTEWAKIPLKFFGVGPTQAVLDLKPDSRLLKMLNTRFVAGANKLRYLKIVSVHETLFPNLKEQFEWDSKDKNSALSRVINLRPALQPIVTPDSAILGLPQEEVIVAESSHHGLARMNYPSRKTILAALSKVVSKFAPGSSPGLIK